MLLADTYRIVRLVGTGGMGEVYEATHSRLAGRYAVKVLLAETSGRSDVFQRFRREAEVTSGLRHPNIVQVVDFNVTPAGHPYLVMEYLDGIELAAEIRRVGAMHLDRVLDIVGQVASALTAAHNHKIIHRDLKPQNMFLVRLPGEDREVVKVVDFGISKVREATTRLTQEATIIGTPQYMAPEQAQGRLSAIDERTDEFALAVITYELLTGRTPFQGDVIPAILYQVVHEQPEPIRNLVPAVSEAVDAVVSRALSKSQNDRYPSVLDYHRDLVRAAAAEHPTAQPVELSDSWAKVSLPSVERVDAGPTTLRSAAAEVRAWTNRSPAGSRRRIGAWIAGVVALASAGVGTIELLGSRAPAGSKPAPPPAPAAAKAPQASAPEPALPKPKNATVEVEDAPPGLRVSADGIPGGLPIVLPYGQETHSLLFEAPGYEPYELRLDGTREHRTLVLPMKRLPAPPVEVVAEKKEPSRHTPTRAARLSLRRAQANPEAGGHAGQATGAPPSQASAEPPKPPAKSSEIITDF